MRAEAGTAGKSPTQEGGQPPARGTRATGRPAGPPHYAAALRSEASKQEAADEPRPAQDKGRDAPSEAERREPWQRAEG